MRLTTKGRYGMRAVVNLASAPGGHPVSISQISAEEEISPEFLEQIFFRLKKAGIIRSLRGPKGGFLLNRDPTEITIKKILDAVGEPIHPTPCTHFDRSKPCSRQDICSMAPIWHRFHAMINDFLSSVTLQDILEQEPKAACTSLGAGQGPPG